MGSNIQLILLITWILSVISIVLAFIWVALRIGPKNRNNSGNHNKDDVINEELRQKLRERGVARFEHTLDQNAAFLQQDLHKISEDIADFIKDRAAEILKDEFTDQKKVLVAAQQHMAESFSGVDKAILDYQKTMADKFNQELAAEKHRRLEKFQNNMAEIITNHVQTTLATNMDVGEQINFILKNMENNKTAIIEDIKREF